MSKRRWNVTIFYVRIDFVRYGALLRKVTQPRLLDLFCGRWGWSRAFAARGWECVGIDLTEPPEIPKGCKFVKADILRLCFDKEIGFYIVDGPILGFFEAIVASSPCEEFSVHSMRNFHPNPPYPELGIRLFSHTRVICEESGLPYLMENVRNAQDFVGLAKHHCGPFYLWGSAVPPLMPQGIKKGFKMGNGKTARALKASGNRQALIDYRKETDCWHSANSPKRIAKTIKVATIPPLLANCVADYTEALRKVTQP